MFKISLMYYPGNPTPNYLFHNHLKLSLNLQYFMLDYILMLILPIRLPCGSVMVVKNWSASSGEADLIPGSGRSPGGGHDNPHQQSYRENPLDKGACQTKVYWITKSQTWLKQLSTHNMLILLVFLFFFSMINATLTLNYRGIVFYFIWLIKF